MTVISHELFQAEIGRSRGESRLLACNIYADWLEEQGDIRGQFLRKAPDASWGRVRQLLFWSENIPPKFRVSAHKIQDYSLLQALQYGLDAVRYVQSKFTRRVWVHHQIDVCLVECQAAIDRGDDILPICDHWNRKFYEVDKLDRYGEPGWVLCWAFDIGSNYRGGYHHLWATVYKLASVWGDDFVNWLAASWETFGLDVLPYTAAHLIPPIGKCADELTEEEA